MEDEKRRPPRIRTTGPPNWVWLKIKQEGLRRFWSMFPLARVAFWCRFVEPQPIVPCPLGESILERCSYADSATLLPAQARSEWRLERPSWGPGSPAKNVAFLLLGFSVVPFYQLFLLGGFLY